VVVTKGEETALGDSAAALGRWLSEHFGAVGPVEVTDVAPMSTGYSAETISLRARYDDGSAARERRLILRRESPGPAVYPQQAPGFDVEVDIQHRVMSALGAGTGIPLASIVGYESSPDVVGAPFFVMDFVEGEVPRVWPSYAQEGFFAQASPSQRRRMIEDGIRVLAELHTLDWDRYGLGWLLPEGEAPTAERQLRIWHDFALRELDGREHPLMSEAVGWLESNMPEHDPDSVTVLWGDPRPGNMIWDDFRCVCVTDFEAAAIGPFLIDLGWWLMFDRCSHEQSGAPRLEGEPTREEQADRYFKASGRAPEPTEWYQILAGVRYSAIVVRVANRSVERGLMSPDNTLWLENPATNCLRSLMG
jgi:aminoglycoside phosphotransferase (APT) family kinase protein